MRHKDEIIETFSVKIIIGGGGIWILLDTINIKSVSDFSGDYVMRNQKFIVYPQTATTYQTIISIRE